MTRRVSRRLRRAVAAAAVVGACAVALAIPVAAAGTDDADAIAATPACASSAIGATAVNPFNGTAPCAGGTTSVQEKYEAAIAGAGILVFAGSTVIYRRRHGQGGRALGPRAPQA